MKINWKVVSGILLVINVATSLKSLRVIDKKSQDHLDALRTALILQAKLNENHIPFTQFEKIIITHLNSD